MKDAQKVEQIVVDFGDRWQQLFVHEPIPLVIPPDMPLQIPGYATGMPIDNADVWRLKQENAQTNNALRVMLEVLANPALGTALVELLTEAVLVRLADSPNAAHKILPYPPAA